MNAEDKRLEESRLRRVHWKRWGPYVSERSWGTVREDYSSNGEAWQNITHDQARSKAYRWDEDGIAGICDRHQRICIALALWNGRDPILKERFFGLAGPEGNHGEDVKECYYYLDSTPTHSYMKFLYKYPQAEFPYSELAERNRHLSRDEPEFELVDSGVFAESRYFDVFVEYAKADSEDVLMRISAVNRGPDPAPLHLLPQVWFRNTWSWGRPAVRPILRRVPKGIALTDESYGKRWLAADGSPEWLFTENETNTERMYGVVSDSQYRKDAFHDFVIQGNADAVNPLCEGTKAAAHYQRYLEPGEEWVVQLRFQPEIIDPGDPFDPEFSQCFDQRIKEANEFYDCVIPKHLSAEARNVMRQSLAGMMWGKQFYHYVVKEWLDGDPAFPPPASTRAKGRNHDWPHLFNADVISVPDKWEYPWYAAWDLAFHCVPIAMVDSDFAKEQLTLLVREWYMHPNGQLPAYEWKLSDVNPPVHAWAARRVFQMERKRGHKPDHIFLERIFHKLLLNFTWWVNRKDVQGRNVFQGGFLGLDNIGVFDRSQPLPFGGTLEQADGTGWMAMYCLNLLAIALELAWDDPAYEDVASKFWEHFLYISSAAHNLGEHSDGMWDGQDGLFYDLVQLPNGSRFPLKIRSMVSLIPLFAVETLEPALLDRLPGFRRRLEWFIANRPDLTCNVASMNVPGLGERRLLSMVNEEQLRKVLAVVLDEKEFLSPYGIRSLSKYHEHHPHSLRVNGHEYRVEYEPGESRTGIFGGNSNWRGPIWFPVNYLLIESLQRFHHYYGDEFRVEFPTGSGHMSTLAEVAAQISRRMVRLFLTGNNGSRPCHGGDSLYRDDPHWKDLVLFYEYFNGNTGAGLGASHQTGWTGLVAKLLQQSGE